MYFQVFLLFYLTCSCTTYQEAGLALSCLFSVKLCYDRIEQCMSAKTNHLCHYQHYSHSIVVSVPVKADNESADGGDASK